MGIRQVTTPDTSKPAVRGWCLKYDDDAFGAPAVSRQKNAQLSFNVENRNGNIRFSELPDKCYVPIYFSINAGPNAGLGHVAIAYRDGGNITIWDSESNSGARGVYRSVEELLRWFGKYAPKYLGWSYWIDGVKAVEDYQEVARKSDSQIADEVIAGLWSNGDERKARLASAGYDYATIQSLVNAKVSGGQAPAPRKSNEDIATEVINGAWGKGQERKDRLAGAGYDYNAIQAIVNRRLA